MQDNERVRIFREALPAGLVIALNQCGWSLVCKEGEGGPALELRAAIGQDSLGMMLFAGLEVFERALTLSGFSQISFYSGLALQADAYSLEEITQLAAPYRARTRALQLRKQCPKDLDRESSSAIPFPLDLVRRETDPMPSIPPG